MKCSSSSVFLFFDVFESWWLESLGRAHPHEVRPAFSFNLRPQRFSWQVLGGSTLRASIFTVRWGFIEDLNVLKWRGGPITSTTRTAVWLDYHGEAGVLKILLHSSREVGLSHLLRGPRLGWIFLVRWGIKDLNTFKSRGGAITWS